jgi:hypothetical protein
MTRGSYEVPSVVSETKVYPVGVVGVVVVAVVTVAMIWSPATTPEGRAMVNELFEPVLPAVCAEPTKEMDPDAPAL